MSFTKDTTPSRRWRAPDASIIIVLLAVVAVIFIGGVTTLSIITVKAQRKQATALKVAQGRLESQTDELLVQQKAIKDAAIASFDSRRTATYANCRSLEELKADLRLILKTSGADVQKLPSRNKHRVLSEVDCTALSVKRVPESGKPKP